MSELDGASTRFYSNWGVHRWGSEKSQSPDASQFKYMIPQEIRLFRSPRAISWHIISRQHNLDPYHLRPGSYRLRAVLPYLQPPQRCSNRRTIPKEADRFIIGKYIWKYNYEQLGYFTWKACTRMTGKLTSVVHLRLIKTIKLQTSFWGGSNRGQWQNITVRRVSVVSTMSERQKIVY